MLTLAINIIGWVGVVLLLIAYYLVSAKRLSGDSAIYQSLNIVGAVLLVANSFYFHAYPSVGVNIVWIGIGIFTLAKLQRKDSA